MLSVMRRTESDRTRPLLLLLAGAALVAAGCGSAHREAGLKSMDLTSATQLPGVPFTDSSVDRAGGSTASTEASTGPGGSALTGPAESLPPEESALDFAPHITNYWFENDIRQVLIDISEEVGIPIVWDNTVQGLVTYAADYAPLEQVLTAVLVPFGYTYRYLEGYYLVGTPSVDNPSFVHLSETRVIPLQYIRVDEALAMLSGFFQPYVRANPSDNTLCVTAPPEMIRRIEADLERQIDRPQPQIMIDAIITDISSDNALKMGLDWAVAGTRDAKEFTLGTDHTDVTSPALAGYYQETGFALRSYTADAMVSLQALVESGAANIRANPRISTLNGHTASITIGKEQYFSVLSGPVNYPHTTLQAVRSGITLEITPFVSSTGEITVQIKPEVSDATGTGPEGLPVISKRSASTYVRVREGETIAIGGLNLDQEKKLQRKIPILGSIPLLGFFFRYNETVKEESEIVILITPHVL